MVVYTFFFPVQKQNYVSDAEFLEKVLLSQRFLGYPNLAISVAIYRGAKCPTLKAAGKTAEEGAEWVPVKQPKNSRKNSRNTRKTVKTAVFPAVFRLFDRDPLGTSFGCFSGCFQCRALWHLCRWPQRLEPKSLQKKREMTLGGLVFNCKPFQSMVSEDFPK